LEVLERLGEHPLGDSWDARLHVGVAQRSGTERADHQHRPLVADPVEHLTDEAAVLRPRLARTADLSFDRHHAPPSVCNRTPSMYRPGGGHQPPPTTPVRQIAGTDSATTKGTAHVLPAAHRLLRPRR